MSKVQHATLIGKLEFSAAQNEYLIDGFSVLDVLEQMNGTQVQMEVVGIEDHAEPLPQSEPPTDNDFFNKLMGDGPAS